MWAKSVSFEKTHRRKSILISKKNGFRKLNINPYVGLLLCYSDFPVKIQGCDGWVRCADYMVTTMRCNVGEIVLLCGSNELFLGFPYHVRIPCHVC